MGCGGSKQAALAPSPAPAQAPGEPTPQQAQAPEPAAPETSQTSGSSEPVQAGDVAVGQAGSPSTPDAATGSGTQLETKAKARVLVAYYSMYGHIKTLAGAVVSGLEASGVEVDVKRISETLPEEVLEKMHAPPKGSDHEDLDITTLPSYDGIIFGCGTRFGMIAAQLKAAFDATGGHWQKGALRGKPVGLFFSTATQGGGQETTALTAVTQFTHHGMIYVPHGYGSPAIQFDNSKAHGGSPYGPGTLAGADGSAQPLEGELDMAKDYGTHFGGVVTALKLGLAA